MTNQIAEGFWLPNQKAGSIPVYTGSQWEARNSVNIDSVLIGATNTVRLQGASGFVSTSSVLEIQSNTSTKSDISQVLAQTSATASGEIVVYRARGTVAAPTTLVASDNIGAHDFFGYNGSSYVRAAIIQGGVSDTGVLGGSIVVGQIGLRVIDAAGTLRDGIRVMGHGGNNVDCYVPYEATGRLSCFQGGPATQQTVVGAKAGNAALGSLLTALAAYGLIVDSSGA